MKTNLCTTIRSTIELSLATVDYTGTQTLYTPHFKKTAELQHVFKSFNYSPIIWDKNYRSSNNFLYATGFCVDIDQGLIIDEARSILDEMEWNYALITTRSHTQEAHRFRIFLPFNRKVHSYADYKRIASEIIVRHFPTSDQKVLDGARQLFASPADAQYFSCWTGQDHDVDETLVEVEGKVRVDNAWTDKLVVKDKGGVLLQSGTINSHTIIYCPFHQDGNAPRSLIIRSPAITFLFSARRAARPSGKKRLCRR